MTGALREQSTALGEAIAAAIEAGYERHAAESRSVVGRAPDRFTARAWRAQHEDAVRLIDLYDKSVQQTLAAIGSIAGDDLEDRAVWAEARTCFRGLIAGRPDPEIAATFFNSITRRVFATGGLAGQLVLSTRGWFGVKDTIVHAGEGPVHAIACAGTMLAWANDVGVKVLGDEDRAFWKDHKGAKVNAIRTRTLIERSDVIVVRFGDKYRQWNAAFDAGYAAALGKRLITLHPEEHTHALKEVDAAALAVASTTEQVVEILEYVTRS